MKKLLSMFSALTMTALIGVGCTDDAKQIEDPIAAAAGDQHSFTLDKDGKVNFKLEIVYFEFDDHTLTQEGRERLNRLSDYLAKHDAKKLRIAGHCDDRGSVEYNLALGQMRSQSVRAYMKTAGVSEARLQAIGFGEERPALKGRGESSWAQNRRAEFAFVN